MISITKLTDAERAEAIVERLSAEYPDASCTLDFQSPWALMVGAILAAQCTDERVNKITPVFFDRFPDIQSAAEAELSEIEPIIRSCGLFRNKARAIKGSASMIIERFDGRIPETREALLELPGIGRKIANLMLGDAFGQQEIVVDTHCKRLAKLMGFTTSDDPLAVERDLLSVVPENARTRWGHLMVSHGREVCRARCRRCLSCGVRVLCQYGAAVVDASDKKEDDCV